MKLFWLGNSSTNKPVAPLSNGVRLVMIAYYSVIARIRLSIRNLRAIQPLLRKVPFARRIPHGIGAGAWRILIPGKGRVWVKVETGLAKGLWLCLNLVGEEKYWLGFHELCVQDV